MVRTFLRKGAHVITTASSKDAQVREARIAKIVEGISPGKWKLEIWHLDLMSMNSVVDFVNKFKSRNSTQLNYFLGNAGVMFPKFKLSEDGFESQFSINYAGHLLLSLNLLPYLHQTARQSGEQSRLVLTTSCLHHIPTHIRFNDLQSLAVYSPHYAYGVSKVSILMFIYKLRFDQCLHYFYYSSITYQPFPFARTFSSRTLKMKSDWGRYVKVFAVHPGLVDTDLLNTIEIMQQYPEVANRITFRVRTHSVPSFEQCNPFFHSQDTKAGAETLIYAALSTQLSRKSGEYLEDSRPAESSRLSYNEDNQNRMWTIASNLLAKWTNGRWFEDL